NLHTGEKDARMELAVLKTIAGFLNTQGGTLVVGVSDDGSPVGLEPDGVDSEDKAALHLVSLLKQRLDGHNALHLHPGFDDHEGHGWVGIEWDRSDSPVFVRAGEAERFFVRYGPTPQELAGTTAQGFIQQRFWTAAPNVGISRLRSSLPR